MARYDTSQPYDTSQSTASTEPLRKLQNPTSPMPSQTPEQRSARALETMARDLHGIHVTLITIAFLAMILLLAAVIEQAMILHALSQFFGAVAGTPAP